MTIIVADRSGIAGAAILHALKARKKPGVKVFWASVWEDVAFYLEQKEQIVIISAHLLRGFKTSLEFATEVKELNPEAGFFVYNGMQDSGGQDLGFHVDGYVPACGPKIPIESVIVPFFTKVIENWAKRPVQLQLF